MMKSKRNIILVCLLLIAVQDGFGHAQIVSDYGWWKIVLLIWSVAPWVVVASLTYTSLLQYFKRKSQSVLATGFGAILFAPLVLICLGVILFSKSCAYVNYAYERHPRDTPRFEQEIPLMKGRVYSWVLGDWFGENTAVCGFYERPLMDGFYWRKCFCRKSKHGTFEIKRTGENSVDCIIDERHEHFDF